MSVEATLATWKLTKEQVTSTEKLFLLSCANRAGENHECWPGIQRLSNDTGLDRKTLIKVRQSVIDKSLMVFTGETKGRTNNIPVMRLTYVNQLEEILNSTEFGIIPKLHENRSQNGTVQQDNSPKNGTHNSPKNGTENLKEESKRNTKKKILKEKVCVLPEVEILAYNENEQVVDKQESDYFHNQQNSKNNNQQNLVRKGNKEKSDYCETQSINKTVSKKQSQFGIDEILNDNLHSIPIPMILDWMRGRKPVTKTAWNRINNVLFECKKHGLDPVECFETMAASAWTSMKLDWFLTKEQKSKFEQAKKRSIELEEMAARRKQREIEDSKRVGKIQSMASELARSKLKSIVGIRASQ